MVVHQAKYFKEPVILLLQQAKLPVADLPETLDNFLVGIKHNKVIGVAGLEVYGSYGLLRSLAVDAAYRNLGTAAALLKRIDEMAKEQALEALYLLTETAPDYFEKKGFVRISRSEVPDELQQSSEFSHVCPQSAIVMKKILK